MTPAKSKENERKSKEFEEEIVVKEYEERIDKIRKGEIKERIARGLASDNWRDEDHKQYFS